MMMSLETARVALSVISVLFIALIWRLLHVIHRQLERMGSRQDAALRALHIVAAEDRNQDGEPPLRVLPPHSG